MNNNCNGEYIADLLRYATKELLPNESVPLLEVADVLIQFLAPFAGTFAESKKRALDSREPMDMYSLSQTVKALWEAVPEIAKPLSYILIDSLPEPPHSPIPPEVLGSLDEWQLRRLLLRKDFALRELRREAYTKSKNKWLRQAAVSSQNFELLDSDISLLAQDIAETEESAQKKIEELFFLAGFCSGGTLVQMQAICDLMTDPRFPEKTVRHSENRVDDGPEFQAERAKGLSPDKLEREVLEMRVYELAKVLNCKADKGRDRNAGKISEGDFESLPKGLRAHLQLVTPHNPWSTYLNLRKAVPFEQWKRSKADLPSVGIGNLELPE